MNILLWIIFGGFAGWVASLITGNDPGLGIFGNIIVGIVGAVIGGWIADRISVGAGEPGADRPTSLAGFIWAVVGAVILLWIINFFL
jgi:uncharacterized membrane protein YeaQ/YmgE (transglycosylase-associated protein family)